MKRIIWLLALVGILSLNTPTVWADEFYVVTGGGGVGTKITSLPATISTPGFYYLGDNLAYSGSGSGAAITISANDVTLDLMGFSLTNNGAEEQTRGITMNGRTNVEIRNGTVRGFGFGVYEASAEGGMHRTINIRAIGNTAGIYLRGTNHLIKNCNATNNYSGFILASGLLTGCAASKNFYGMVVYGPGSVLNNTATNNSENNFYFGYGVPTAILVDRNSAFGRSVNYNATDALGGVKWGTNAGTP